jgi:hypothetical protein
MRLTRRAPALETPFCSAKARTSPPSSFLTPSSRAMMMPRLTNDPADVDRFLCGLYSAADGGCLEVRGIDPAGKLRSKSEWFPAIAIGAGACQYAANINAEGYDVFFGVNPRVVRGQDDESILSGVALWCDIDNLGSVDAAEAKLEEALAYPLPPDAAVFSGGGVHLYWFLKEAADPADDDAWDRYLRSLRRVCEVHGGDAKCNNPSRVLRFPLTKSHKRGAQTLLWVKEEV